MKNLIKDGDELIGGGKFQGENPIPDIINHLKQRTKYQEKREQVDKFNKVLIFFNSFFFTEKRI